MTLNLLDPNEIKEEKKEGAISSQRLIAELAVEEAKINKDLNILREFAKLETERIKKETDEFVDSQQLRVTELKKEVEGLEARRTEALKPIHQVRGEATKLLEEAKQALERAEQRERDAEALHEKNLDVAEDLHDQKVDLDEREAKIEGKENSAKAEESRLKDSANALANKWVEFHTAGGEANAKLIERENKLKMREEAADIRHREQEERDVALKKEVRAIADKYETLERATKEVKKKLGVDHIENL